MVQPSERVQYIVNQTEFQYILCYGSTSLLTRCNIRLKNFNTSYVMVQLKERNDINCILMNFNTSYVMVQPR